MKRLMGLLVMVFLAGCNASDTRPPSDMENILENLEIPGDYLIAQTTEHGRDLMEHLDYSNRQAVIIHVIEGDMDYMIKLTPEYVYDTRSMNKSPSSYDPDCHDSLENHLSFYSMNLTFKVIERAFLMQTYHRMEDAYFNEGRMSTLIRGKDRTRPQGIGGEFHIIEIVYHNNVLWSYHFQNEADFTSTKRRSNVLSATNFYFGEGPIKTFPDLSEFD